MYKLLMVLKRKQIKKQTNRNEHRLTDASIKQHSGYSHYIYILY